MKTVMNHNQPQYVCLPVPLQVEVHHLFAHAVDAIGPQQVHGLLHQVRPSTVEHPEAQVLQELGLGGGSIQLPGGAETVLCSAGRTLNLFSSEFSVCFSITPPSFHKVTFSPRDPTLRHSEGLICVISHQL